MTEEELEQIRHQNEVRGMLRNAGPLFGSQVMQQQAQATPNQQVTQQVPIPDPYGYSPVDTSQLIANNVYRGPYGNWGAYYDMNSFNAPPAAVITPSTTTPATEPTTTTTTNNGGGGGTGGGTNTTTLNPVAPGVNNPGGNPNMVDDAGNPAPYKGVDAFDTEGDDNFLTQEETAVLEQVIADEFGSIDTFDSTKTFEDQLSADDYAAWSQTDATADNYLPTSNPAVTAADTLYNNNQVIYGTETGNNVTSLNTGQVSDVGGVPSAGDTFEEQVANQTESYAEEAGSTLNPDGTYDISSWFTPSESEPAPEPEPVNTKLQASLDNPGEIQADYTSGKYYVNGNEYDSWGDANEYKASLDDAELKAQATDDNTTYVRDSNSGVYYVGDQTYDTFSDAYDAAKINESKANPNEIFYIAGEWYVGGENKGSNYSAAKNSISSAAPVVSEANETNDSSAFEDVYNYQSEKADNEPNSTYTPTESQTNFADDVLSDPTSYLPPTLPGLDTPAVETAPVIDTTPPSQSNNNDDDSPTHAEIIAAHNELQQKETDMINDESLSDDDFWDAWEEDQVENTPTSSSSSNDDSGSSSSSSGGGTVICTALHDLGLIDKRTHTLAERWAATRTDDATYYGYLHWATPVANGIREGRYGIFKYLGVFWADQMAYEMTKGRQGKQTVKGWLCCRLGLAFSKLIGVINGQTTSIDGAR